MDPAKVIGQIILRCIVEQTLLPRILVEVLAGEPSLTIIDHWLGFLGSRCLGACISDIGILPNHSLASKRGRGVPDHVCVCSSLIVVDVEYVMRVKDKEDQLLNFPRSALDHVERGGLVEYVHRDFHYAVIRTNTTTELDLLYAIPLFELDVMLPLGDVLSPSKDDNSGMGNQLAVEITKTCLYLVPIGVFFCPLDASAALGDEVVPDWDAILIADEPV